MRADWQARRRAATAPARPGRLRAVPLRRDRSRRAGESGWRVRGVIRRGKYRLPPRASVRRYIRLSWGAIFIRCYRLSSRAFTARHDRRAKAERNGKPHVAFPSYARFSAPMSNFFICRDARVSRLILTVSGSLGHSRSTAFRLRWQRALPKRGRSPVVTRTRFATESRR